MCSRGHCLLWNRSNATRTACDSSHSVAIVDIDNEGRGVKAMPMGSQCLDRWWLEAYHNVDTKAAN